MKQTIAQKSQVMSFPPDCCWSSVFPLKELELAHVEVSVTPLFTWILCVLAFS